MATMRLTAAGWISGLGALAYTAINLLGDVSLFAANTLAWMVRRRPAASAFWSSCYNVGVRSLPVVAITGMFIGMVLAVQSYHEFYNLGLATRLGSIINISVVRELGPVLAATMIAGRVGSAIKGYIMQVDGDVPTPAAQAAGEITVQGIDQTVGQGVQRR